MSLESGYLLGRKQAIRTLIKVDTKDLPILVIQIEEERGEYIFKDVRPYQANEVEILPTRIEGPAIPYLPSLVAKDRLSLAHLKDEKKRGERIDKFQKAIKKKLNKIVKSAQAMNDRGNAGHKDVSEFGKAVDEALKKDGAEEKIASMIVDWAKERPKIDGLVLACAVDGVLPPDIHEVDTYLESVYKKRIVEHSGTKVDGLGICAWCGQQGNLSARMDYWKPGNVDNPYAVPFGRKEDSYKVIPICLSCHARIKNGVDRLNRQYTVRPGGGVQVMYAPRLLASVGQGNIAEDIQIFWDEIQKEVERGVQQASRLGTRVMNLRGTSTTVSDLADELEGACLTFDVSWIKSENSAVLILARAQDVVPTWLLKLADITDRVNRSNDTWSPLAPFSQTYFKLDGSHFWRIFKQPSKQQAGKGKRDKGSSVKTLHLPWEVAAEVLEKRIKPFDEFLPDFFRGVDAYWTHLEEKERRDVVTGKGLLIREWVSLWHRFSFYVHLVQKEITMDKIEPATLANSEEASDITDANGNQSVQETDHQYVEQVSTAATQEADSARVFQTKTERGVFLVGIALGMLAIYQDKDGKTMRVLDYPGDYRLDKKAYDDFLLRFWDKLKEYLYVNEFKTSKGPIILAIMSAATERTNAGFENLSPERVGFALLSGVMRANHYYFLKGANKNQGE